MTRTSFGSAVRGVLAAGACAAILVVPAAARAAETFRFVGMDGTVYYTNAPTDPAYRRMGFTGTKAGFLKVSPAVATSATLADHVRDAAIRYGVPEKLVNAVIRVESGFNPRAVSSKGARGLMQLMPQTASMLGVRDSFDPADNIDGGVRHLRGLIDRYGSDLKLALAAYNAGEGAVSYYRGIPPFAETQGYVAKVLSYIDGEEAAAAASTATVPPRQTFRLEQQDGTVVYTNIPPRVRR